MTPDPVVVGELVDTTNGSKSMVLIIDELGGGRLDVGGCYGIDAAEDLGGGHSSAVGEELTANVLGDVGVAIKAHEHGGLEVDLGALDLLVGGAVDETDEVGHDVPHEVVELVVGSEGVDAEEAAVLVAGVEGGDGVGELVLGNLLAHLGGNVLTQAGGAVVGTEHGLHDHEGEGVLGGPAGTLEGQGDVGGVVGIESDANVNAGEDGGIVGGINGTGGGGGKLAKMGRGQVAKLGVVDGTGTSDDHAGGGVVGVDVVAEVGLGEAADVLLGAEDGAPETGALEGGGVEVVQNELLLLLVDLGHFPKDDVALPLDGGLLELGVEEDVGEDLNGLTNILLEDLGEVDSLLTGGVGVAVVIESEWRDEEGEYDEKLDDEGRRWSFIFFIAAAFSTRSSLFHPMPIFLTTILGCFPAGPAPYPWLDLSFALRIILLNAPFSICSACRHYQSFPLPFSPP